MHILQARITYGILYKMGSKSPPGAGVNLFGERGVQMINRVTPFGGATVKWLEAKENHIFHNRNLEGSKRASGTTSESPPRPTHPTPYPTRPPKGGVRILLGWVGRGGDSDVVPEARLEPSEKHTIKSPIQYRNAQNHQISKGVCK